MGDGGGVEEEKEGGSVFTLHGVSSNYSALIAPMSTYVTCVSVTHCNLLSQVVRQCQPRVNGGSLCQWERAILCSEVTAKVWGIM